MKGISFSPGMFFGGTFRKLSQPKVAAQSNAMQLQPKTKIHHAGTESRRKTETLKTRTRASPKFMQKRKSPGIVDTELRRKIKHQQNGYRRWKGKESWWFQITRFKITRLQIFF
jgi:hypothetical protein